MVIQRSKKNKTLLSHKELAPRSWTQCTFRQTTQSPRKFVDALNFHRDSMLANEDKIVSVIICLCKMDCLLTNDMTPLPVHNLKYPSNKYHTFYKIL